MVVSESRAAALQGRPGKAMRESVRARGANRGRSGSCARETREASEGMRETAHREDEGHNARRVVEIGESCHTAIAAACWAVVRARVHRHGSESGGRLRPQRSSAHCCPRSPLRSMRGIDVRKRWVKYGGCADLGTGAVTRDRVGASEACVALLPALPTCRLTPSACAARIRSQAGQTINKICLNNSVNSKIAFCLNSSYA